FESVVKLLAFLAVGIFVTYGLFDGMTDIFARVRAVPELASLLGNRATFDYGQWFSLTLLAMLSVVLLPRQFQIMVVENVSERHLRRAAWVFPAYLLLINVFVLPVALGGLLLFGSGNMDPEAFVLSMPLANGQYALALLAFIGGLSAATGMVIVESIAVSSMVCNDLVMPLLLRTRRFGVRAHGDLTRLLLGIRRTAIFFVMLLGYSYFHWAGEAYALVSIGLISFAAVAQFAPALFGGMYWRGGTRVGAMTGLLIGFGLWTYTLMLPSIAKSGWLPTAFLQHGPWGIQWLKPEQLFGLSGMDSLTHSLFWSLSANLTAYVVLSLWRGPTPAETSQALLFVEVFQRNRSTEPVFWRGRAKVQDLLALTTRFIGSARARRLFDEQVRRLGVQTVHQIEPDAPLVRQVEIALAGAIGSASARVMVASVADEDALALDDVLQILDEATRLRAHSIELEEKSASLEHATAELRAANAQLQSLDRLKDDFMSSVTHELRTPLTSIRTLAELMADEPDMQMAQRQQFVQIIVTETERLSRLVNQVLDLAKIESGHAQWHNTDIDLGQLLEQAVQTTERMFRDRGGAHVQLSLPPQQVVLRADPDRLTQVVLNLLSNAAKFIPATGGRVDITLRTSDEGVQVAIQDNGPGVPAGEHGMIFEKFHQTQDGGYRPQGTGLGLPISRQIVEHFGGRIWIDPAHTGGARFVFELPWNTIAVASVADAPASGTAVAGDAPHIPT
ncbi:MAG: ATP-binding protein, partial [Betaproteobacteria bacterium]